MPFVYCETPGCRSRVLCMEVTQRGWFINANQKTAICPKCAMKKLADSHVNCGSTLNAVRIPSDEMLQVEFRMRDAVNTAMAAVGDHE